MKAGEEILTPIIYRAAAILRRAAAKDVVATGDGGAFEWALDRLPAGEYLLRIAYSGEEGYWPAAAEVVVTVAP